MLRRLIRKTLSAKKTQMLMLMLLGGVTTVMAQNSAGDYSAGTTALATVTEEIAKYVPIMVKLCYAIAGVVAIVGAISVYIAMNNEEQDVKKKILHFPDCRSTGPANVLRNQCLKRSHDERQGRTLSRLPAVQGATTAS